MSHLSRDLKRSGELAYAKVEKVNSELFSLTYGAVVMQVLQDYEDVDATNAQLEKMSAPSRAARKAIAQLRSLPRRGYNIGVRLIDEFLAKAQVSSCSSFHETADVIAKVAPPSRHPQRRPV